MKSFLPILLVLITSIATTAHAQYYYKDIISTRESAGMLKAYRDAKVRAVRMVSYDGEGVKDDNLLVVQTFAPREGMLRTFTQSSAGSQPSILLTYLNEAGQVIKTIDSSRLAISVTSYTYNTAGQLETINRSMADSANEETDNEVHRWEYAGGKPVRMVRIKNGKDTAVLQLKLDEAGNVIEELLVRRGLRTEPFYYYYDDQNRLTDVVRYNNKARKLLPEIMFEYSPAGQVIQRITVPGNSSNYLIWRYQYDSRGLKTKEAIYDKFKQLNGKIEYMYSFGA